MLVRSYEDEIRAAIVEDDLIECVITFRKTCMKKHWHRYEVMILNPQKPAERKGGILLSMPKIIGKGLIPTNTH